MVTHLTPTSKVSGSNPGRCVAKLVVCLPMVGSLQCSYLHVLAAEYITCSSKPIAFSVFCLIFFLLVWDQVLNGKI